VWRFWSLISGGHAGIRSRLDDAISLKRGAHEH
jgi:hypothetical protein